MRRVLLSFLLVVAGCSTAATAPSITSNVPTPSQSALAPVGLSSPTTEPTVEPTLKAAVTPKPPPPPKPTPEPGILKTAGRGDKIVRFTAQDAPTVARITGSGGGNFAVISYAGSEYGDLLVNEIGSYAGWVYIAAGENRLKVSSSGKWTIEIRPIATARAWDGVSSLLGKGDTVVLLTGGPDATSTFKNKSHSNFAVIAYSPEGEYLDLLVNEIGNYDGEVMLPGADPMVLVLHAVGGTWSMSAVTP